MSTRVVRALIVVALVATSVGACSSSGNSNAPYAAKDFATGRAVSTTQLRGRPALLVSWATWCKECRTELPALEAYHEQHASDPLQIVLVNVNSGGSANDIRDMVTRFHVTMTQWRDQDNDFGSRFRTPGVPTAVLLDRNGAVVRTWPGAINPNGVELADAIGKL